ncbi:MAG TPA: SURF1 family protein [Burkholderiales bacterium]|nr:SURF1 family protein [Burkholderiales bacterium]
MKLPEKRSRWWPALATAIGVAVTLALGNWQLDRAAQKRAIKERYETMAAQPPINVGREALSPEGIDLRRIEARGVFEPQRAVFVDNRIHHGVPGYHVVMPLKIEGSEVRVLVNRGWVARPALRSELPAVKTPRGPVTVSGTATVPHRGAFERSDTVVEGRIVQNLTIQRYTQMTPIAVQPFVLRQDSALDDGLQREWPAPDFGIEKHYGYAFQWFALAATLTIFYAYTQLKRKRPNPGAEPPAA